MMNLLPNCGRSQVYILVKTKYIFIYIHYEYIFSNIYTYIYIGESQQRYVKHDDKNYFINILVDITTIYINMTIQRFIEA